MFTINLFADERPVVGECCICLHGLAYRAFRVPTDRDNTISMLGAYWCPTPMFRSGGYSGVLATSHR